MPLVVPARNVTARPYWKLAQLLASLSTVQAALEVDTAAEALAKIHWPWANDTPDPEDPTQPIHRRPRIIIEKGGRCHGTKTSTYWQVRGRLNLTIELPLQDADGNWPELYWPADYNPGPSVPTSEISEADQMLAADNVIGGIIAQMLTRANTSPGMGDISDALPETFLDVQEFDEILPTTIASAPDFEGHYFAVAVFAVEFWG